MVQMIERLPPDAQALIADFIEMLQRRYSQVHTPQTRDERLRKFAGAIRVGTGADNESIDADLAREYGNEIP
jgi:hypothetical protein